MGWFYFESLIALFVLLAIVWWTMRRRASRPPAPSASPILPASRSLPATIPDGPATLVNARSMRRSLHGQCSVRGIDSVNGGMGASNAVPSSAIIW